MSKGAPRSVLCVSWTAEMTTQARYLFRLLQALCLWFVLCPYTATSQERLEFSCSTFSPDTSEAGLVRQFGSGNVRTGPVAGGGAEGEYTEGTLMFPEAMDAKAEILWKNRASKSEPSLIWIVGARSRWRSPEGITLGSDLKMVERVNRRPFRMAGLGFDGSGTVISWSRGRLAGPDEAPCRMRLSLDERFQPATGPNAVAAIRALSRQVMGDRQDFSSGHPAMQALNLRVYRMFLEYDR